MLSLVVGVMVYFARPQALYAALPILLLWAWAKPVSLWLNRPPRAVGVQTSRRDELFLRKAAAAHLALLRRVLATQEHNWLIPDNVQETPPNVAARISPTNLGFLLNARQVACEFGYLTVPEFVEQTKRTMQLRCGCRGSAAISSTGMTRARSSPTGRVSFRRWIAATWSRHLSRCSKGARYAAPASARPALLDGYADHLCALAEMKLLSKRVVASFRRQGTIAGSTECWQRVDLPRLPTAWPGLETLSGFAHKLVIWWSKYAIRSAGLHALAAAAIRSPCTANPALGNLGWSEDLTLEKLPRFIDQLHAKLLLAHGGRNAVAEATLRDRLRSAVASGANCARSA